MSDDKKTLNYINVDTEVFSWLVNQANAQGERLGDFVGAVLEEVSQTWCPPMEDEPERLLFWNYMKVQREERLRKMVYQAAAIYHNHPNPTEDEADRLASMYEAAGMDYKEVVKEVSDDPFSSIIAHSQNGSATGQCMRWLAGVMKNRKVMPVKLVMVKARQEGFSDSTLTRARGAINMDDKSPTIATRKRAYGWEWYIEDDEDAFAVS